MHKNYWCISQYRLGHALTFLLLSTLVGCSDTPPPSTNNLAAGDSGIHAQLPTNFPYYNDFDIVEGTEADYQKHNDLSLGENWAFVETGGRVDSWYLGFYKPGEGLGSSREGTAEITKVITIPGTATYPVLRFWHQLHLEKSHQSVIVELLVVGKQDQYGHDDWIILQRFKNNSNTDNYQKITLDLSDYIGESIRLRFRTKESGSHEYHANNEHGSFSTNSKYENDTKRSDDKTHENDRNQESDEGRGNGRNRGNDDSYGNGRNQGRDSKRGSARDQGNDGGRSSDRDQRDGDSHGSDRGHGDNDEGRGNDQGNDGRHTHGHHEVYWRIDNLAVHDKDTDDDGISDAFELRLDSDPTNPQDVPDDNNKDGIPDVINDMMGFWQGPCRYLGGGEYQRTFLYITEFDFEHRYENSGSSDCSKPWIDTHKIYRHYEIHKREMIEEPAGAELDLSLWHTVVIPIESEVSISLTKNCSVKPFSTGNKTVVDNMTCTGDVKYPKSKIIHYERIQNANNIIHLGDHFDETDPRQRATSYGANEEYKKAGS